MPNTIISRIYFQVNRQANRQVGYENVQYPTQARGYLPHRPPKSQVEIIGKCQTTIFLQIITRNKS